VAVRAETYHSDWRRGRASSQTSANRFRTTRYANDQSKQPSFNHDGKRAEPSQVTVGEEADEFANPTRRTTISSSLELSDRERKSTICSNQRNAR
jgi:hypothetical protein